MSSLRNICLLTSAASAWQSTFGLMLPVPSDLRPRWDYFIFLFACTIHAYITLCTVGFHYELVYMWRMSDHDFSGSVERGWGEGRVRRIREKTMLGHSQPSSIGIYRLDYKSFSSPFSLSSCYIVTIPSLQRNILLTSPPSRLSQNLSLLSTSFPSGTSTALPPARPQVTTPMSIFAPSHTTLTPSGRATTSSSSVRPGTAMALPTSSTTVMRPTSWWSLTPRSISGSVWSRSTLSLTPMDGHMAGPRAVSPVPRALTTVVSVPARSIREISSRLITELACTLVSTFLVSTLRLCLLSGSTRSVLVRALTVSHPPPTFIHPFFFTPSY